MQVKVTSNEALRRIFSNNPIATFPFPVGIWDATNIIKTLNEMHCCHARPLDFNEIYTAEIA